MEAEVPERHSWLMRWFGVQTHSKTEPLPFNKMQECLVKEEFYMSEKKGYEVFGEMSHQNILQA